MRLFIFILIIFYHNLLLAQDKIAAFKNFNEVKEFVKTMRPKFSFIDLKSISSKKLDKLLDKENFANQLVREYQIDSNYYIRDFNNDGYKDLLIYGYEQGLNVMVIMNYGDRYKSYNLYLNEFGAESIFPKIENNNNLITLYEIETSAHDRMTNQEKPIKHVLTYRDSAFVEYNPNPKEYAIDSLIVSISCPWWHHYKHSFHIQNTNNYVQIRNEKTKYQLNPLEERQWQKIKNILNYADFPSIDLPKYYIEDNISYRITVYYNDGLVKTIRDDIGHTNKSLALIYKEITPLIKEFEGIVRERSKPRLPGLK